MIYFKCFKAVILMQKNQLKEIEVVCHDLSSEGKGVVNYQGKVGFVDNLLFIKPP